ncbi:MAG TPA: tetratricopeptide repeat protein [Candidatus Acidoferrum sp.]|nr:tetratricopeptide repeat protein [Candidatus Acidoferrum sp.]
MSRKKRSRKLAALSQARSSTPATAPRTPGSARQPADPPVEQWVHRLMPWLIVVFTVAAFLPTLENQFVGWDDTANLVDNPHYRGLGWPQVRWMWTTFHMGHYIPLTWMTFGVDYLLWGMTPLGYHLTSLLLHAANGVVFYFLALRLLTAARPRAVESGGAGLAISSGFAALLFALHPLRVESVAWATERRDVLSGCFYLLTILVYLRAIASEKHGRQWYWLSVALFACAGLSKSIVVNLPLVLLILDIYPLRRVGGSAGWWGERARRVYLEKVPFVLLAVLTSVAAFAALVRLQNMMALAQLSMLERVAVSAYGLSFYLWKTVAPFSLTPLYELPATLNLWAPLFLLSYLMVVALTAGFWVLRHRWPALLAVWLTYVLILLPVLGPFQNGPQVGADRYTYLAGLGLALLAGGCLSFVWRLRPFLAIGLVGGILPGLAILTWHQVHIWRTSETLWAHAVTIDPRSSIAHINLGTALLDRGKPAAAIEHFQQAVNIRPDYAEAHYNWGTALTHQGKLAEAIDHFQQAVRIRPDYAEVHNNWGTALLDQRKLGEAIDHFQQAIQIRPDYAEAHSNLGFALALQGKPAEAIERYQQALRIQPDYAGAHFNWGAALAQQGKTAEAIGHYEKALRAKPDFPEAHSNWGTALAQQGNLAAAIEHFKQAVQIRPDYAEAHNNLGFALASQGELAEAVEHYRQALRIQTDYVTAQVNLANALQRITQGQTSNLASSRPRPH